MASKAPAAPGAIPIDTYFGFFAQSVFTALAGALGSQTGRRLRLERVRLSASNTLKLRWSNVDTVLVPVLAEPVESPFVFALSAQDVAALGRLAGGKVSLQHLMEQALSTAVEPFNMMTKTRNRLRSVTFSRNVTGLTASHLGGAVQYTMATGDFKADAGKEGALAFSLRFLVTPQGRDLIEERATQNSTQRALFTINSGAYACRPQWEPPPPPPGAEQGQGLSEAAMGGWVQSFLGLNDGLLANRLFQRPVGLTCTPVTPEMLAAMFRGAPVTVVRLQANDEKALELFVLLQPQTKKVLLTLSKSGQEKFLGDLFRALLTESAQLWARFSGQPVRWSALAVRDIPADALDAVTSRLQGGGFAQRQEARVDDGKLEWAVAVPPHTWRWMLTLTAQGLGLAVPGAPDRGAIYAASGWATGQIPWELLAPALTPRELTEVGRVLGQPQQAGGPPSPWLGVLLAGVPQALRERWLAALPALLRERAERERVEPPELQRLAPGLAGTLLAHRRAQRLPEGRLADWLALHGELLWARRQAAIDKLLPPRHLVYGMDRASLGRLLFDSKESWLLDMLCAAEFPVMDQIRRAITPGYALRLLEDVATRRPRTTAFAAQEGLLTLYRRTAQGVEQGRYLLRPTPSQRLQQVLRLVDAPAPAATPREGATQSAGPAPGPAASARPAASPGAPAAAKGAGAAGGTAKPAAPARPAPGAPGSPLGRPGALPRGKGA